MSKIENAPIEPLPDQEVSRLGNRLDLEKKKNQPFSITCDLLKSIRIEKKRTVLELVDFNLELVDFNYSSSILQA